MASAAKLAANRANAQKSTGPRSAAGKARTRYNAYVHGLSIPRSYDQATAARIEDLVCKLSPSREDPENAITQRKLKKPIWKWRGCGRRKWTW